MNTPKILETRKLPKSARLKHKKDNHQIHETNGNQQNWQNNWIKHPNGKRIPKRGIPIKHTITIEYRILSENNEPNYKLQKHPRFQICCGNQKPWDTSTIIKTTIWLTKWKATKPFHGKDENFQNDANRQQTHENHIT